MVGSLNWKGSDPERKGRGAGWYWHRGKGVYSKYTGKVDSKHKAKVLKIRDSKTRGKAQVFRPHTHDYKKIKGKRTLKTSAKGHRIPKTPKGYY